MKAYEIIGAMEDTLDIFLESDGTEVDKETYDDVMEFLKEELNNKSSSILKYIRNLELDSKIAKDEADRLDKISKSKMNKVKKLKDFLLNIMQYLDKKQIETDLGSYGIRNSTKVDVYDMALLPSEFIRIKEEVTPDKEKIADYIKKNGELNGARIITGYSLQIR